MAVREAQQHRAIIGGVAEWSNAAVLKTVRPSRVSWVRILPPPQTEYKMGSPAAHRVAGGSVTIGVVAEWSNAIVC